MSGGNARDVFYADKYHPIQAGSIDGTDVAPHDNAVLRALICSQAGLYDPFGDPKATGDPYCTVFVGRLSRQTDDDTLREAMSRYGKVKSMRLVRDIVTGASRGYAFVEYETDREMRRAYQDAHHSIIDGSEVIVDYYRQQLMPGWIPRRLGGGLGGRKESGQLRFGGRERPFRAPLQPIPYESYDKLKKLGIPPPPEGRYMTRYQVPPPPRWKSSNTDMEDSPPRRRSKDRASDSAYRRQRSSTDDDETPRRRKSGHNVREESQSRRSARSSVAREDSSYSSQRKPTGHDDGHRKRRRSREPGEVSPSDEDGSCKRERTSTESGRSPDRYMHHHRHHTEDAYESRHSEHRDRRRHGDRHHSKRSDSRDGSH
ncbi:hypothetical protein SEVIR_2G282200v4 [Setaria viridis]|uniref:RRM domain-containing protein n=2 Tax=Setaria TaxID=4554 RepID=K3ZUE1_SETIT|nr:U11/U12 small nuclear ribonucleoprotein 35 kDa protein [Setaria italica]XP_034582370.1 U11/U12 small nuclear ribonucleoprotein 35 kDa protein [Setaria viridis]RCV12463.1 hypothetical protein SETIT_2G271500v2 [Setaria italica]TKW34093.1 hypothetical protein SEVIR_2G282200v2 [Setaria viridis]